MTGVRSELVTGQRELGEMLERVRAASRVAFDTEFISEGVYEPYLCLLQLATDDGIWIVDPLALPDLSELWQLLTAPERELVVLAAREEVRFCLRYAARPPARLVDVQVAAGLVGHGYPLSHTNLVRKALGVTVAGGEAFTDWKRRPLSPKQLEYAADDVRHLLALRDALMEDAGRLERVHWIEGECADLVNRLTAAEQEQRWWKVSGGGGLSRRELAVLREVWRWRDTEAREQNLPQRRILRDELLVEIAKRKPTETADLFALRGMDRGMARNAGKEIVASVQRAMKLPDSELPRSLRRDDPPQLGVLTQIVALVSNNLASKHRVDPALLATASDLQDMVRWRLAGAKEGEEPEWLTGWRADLLREPILGLLNGDYAIRVGNLKSDAPLRLDMSKG